MFNIIKTPRNNFTRKLLHDSNVAFHCIVSHWRPYWEVSCWEEVFCRPSTAPVMPANRDALQVPVCTLDPGRANVTYRAGAGSFDAGAACLMAVRGRCHNATCLRS